MRTAEDILEYLKELETKEQALKSEYGDKLRAVQAEQSRVRLALMGAMNTAGLTNASFEDGSKVQVYTHRTVQIEDPMAFFNYVIETHQVNLLHRRISQREALTTIDNGKDIPGVHMNSEQKLRVTYSKK